MRNSILFGLVVGLAITASAQLREVWRYEYTPDDPSQVSRIERTVRLQDGGWLLLGWTGTTLNGQDALAIKLSPDGLPEWIFQRDGVGFDDAFVDALEFSTWQGLRLYMLERFTDSDGFLQTRLLIVNPSGQIEQERLLPSLPTTHNRPLQIVNIENAPYVLVEQVSDTSSRFRTFDVNNNNWFLISDIRPWTVVAGESTLSFASPVLVMSTIARPAQSLDVFLLDPYDGWTIRYSGPANGFDVPSVGFARFAENFAQSGFWVALQSEGATNENIVLLRLSAVYGLVWGYRYINSPHDNFAESITVDTQGNTHLLVRTNLWPGEPFERITLNWLQFSPNGTLLRATPVEVGRSPLDLSPLRGILRLNEAGQLFVLVDNPSYLARLQANGQPVWTFNPDLIARELFIEQGGSLVAVGEKFIQAPNTYRTIPRPTVVQYTPSGDVNGDGCVDDADLLTVLFGFGSNAPNADVNADGVVDDADLLIVLFNFGSGC